MTVQTLTSDSGDELVVLSRRDYDVLLARSGDEAAEDRLSAQIVARSTEALERGDDAALPEAVWTQLEQPGANALQVLRRFRGLSEAQLAEAAGIAEAHLKTFETGEAKPSPGMLDALARALNLQRDLLEG
jgi:ribosome-binding protein aMBF1 (putative translation factor)